MTTTGTRQYIEDNIDLFDITMYCKGPMRKDGSSTMNTYTLTTAKLRGDNGSVYWKVWTMYNEGEPDTTKVYDKGRTVTHVNKKIQERLAKGYRLTKQEALDFVDNRVQLVKKIRPSIDHTELSKFWKKHVRNGEYLLGTPKLNGLCSTLSSMDIRSRNDKPFARLSPIDFLGPGHSPSLKYLLHGELYAHGYSLQDIVSMVKGSKCNDDLLFYAFDYLTPESIGYLNRLTNLVEHCSNYPKVRIIQAVPLYTFREARRFYEWCLDQEFEGAVYRNPNEIYQFGKKTWGSVKLKPLLDEEYMIVGDSADKYGRVIYTCAVDPEKPKGMSFNVVPKWIDERRQGAEAFGNVGKLLTVEFFEYTDAGIPRHPVGLEVRDYE